MKCDEVREEADLLNDGSCRDIEHLAKCEDCSRYFAFHQRLKNLAVNEIQAPEDLADRIVFRLTAMDRIRAGRSGGQAQGMPFFIKAFGGFAAAAFFSFIFLFVYYSGTPQGITEFALTFPEAETVALCGDFNNWQKDVLYLTRENGRWTIPLRLRSGEYKYVYIVNGRKIVADPEKETVEDGFGGYNSVIKI